MTNQLSATPDVGISRTLRMAGRGAADVTGSSAAFQQAWTQAASSFQGATRTALHTVRPGETLTGIVTNHLAAAGQKVDGQTAWRLAQQVAVSNGIANPDLIQPGQGVDLSTLAVDAAAPPMTAMRKAPANVPSAANPLLKQTLARAVDKGYMTAQESRQVQQRIVGMGQTYGFSPDDFARVVLMESDGFNPRASNGQCHGIIQFCEGEHRGAGSVGMAGRAQDIREMGVMAQLDLVERYFQDTGLRPGGQPLTLADLYLSVLTPAARAVKDLHQPLPIAGKQAKALYVDADRSRAITKSSLTQGLWQHASQRLSAHQEVGLPEKVALAGGGNKSSFKRQFLAAELAYQSVARMDGAERGGKGRLP